MGLFSRIKTLWKLSEPPKPSKGCPHGRAHWGGCPWCLGINTPSNDAPVQTGMYQEQKPARSGKAAVIVKKSRKDPIDEVLEQVNPQ